MTREEYEDELSREGFSEEEAQEMIDTIFSWKREGPWSGRTRNQCIEFFMSEGIPEDLAHEWANKMYGSAAQEYRMIRMFSANQELAAAIEVNND